MALNMQRRRSSWFGPQFSLQSFPWTSFGTSNSPRSSIYELRRDSKTQESEARQSSLATAEPLFQDSYLTEEDENTVEEKHSFPQFSWNVSSDEDCGSDESLEDLGFELELDDEETHVVATCVAYMHVGKPKVVDISPPSSIRSVRKSPRPFAAGSYSSDSVSWRMPSYSSTSSRASSTYSSETDRTSSFDSRSSYSEGPKTPDLLALDSPMFPEIQLRNAYPERTNSLRRHSRNLSASFSKAFLNRAKDTTGDEKSMMDSTLHVPLPRGVTKQALIYDVPPVPNHKEDSTTFTKRTPVLRRTKGLGDAWHQR